MTVALIRRWGRCPPARRRAHPLAARDLQQGGYPQAGIRSVQQSQPARNDEAILIAQRHHIRHRANRHQIQIVRLQRRKDLLSRPSGAQLLAGADQLEGHAYPRQLLEGIGAVRAMGIHHRHTVRQGVQALMVIRHDGVHAARGGVGHLLHGRHAGIYRDDQGDPLRRQGIHPAPGHSVALPLAIGNVAADP